MLKLLPALLLPVACSVQPAPFSPASPPASAPAAAPALSGEPSSAPQISASIPCSVAVSADVSPPVIDRDPASPSGRNARAWVTLLASPELKGRRAGTADAKRAARLIARELAADGFKSTQPDGDLCQRFPLDADLDQNVVAILPARTTPTDLVIIGAHYDHLGEQGGRIFPGADDNASGVAAILEIARVLGKRGGLTSRGVVLIAFGGEESGTVGSTYFAAHPTVDLAAAIRMINLDMVGRPFLDGQVARYVFSHPDESIGYVVSERGKTATEAAIAEAASKTGVRTIGISENILRSMGFSSDSVPFSAKVPTVFFSTSIHDDYHKPTDTADKVDGAQIERVANLVLAMIGE